jgi:hypothetical protein
MKAQIVAGIFALIAVALTMVGANKTSPGDWHNCQSPFSFL